MENKEFAKHRLSVMMNNVDIDNTLKEKLLNEACAQRMLGIHNKDITHLTDAGKLFEMTGQYKTAIECYNRVLDL